jgi:hypothetical protein
VAGRPGIPATGCPYERDRWAAQAEIARMEAPEVKDWHRAVEALRRITAQSSPVALFLDRYRSFDHAIGDELRQAHAWINDMQKLQMTAYAKFDGKTAQHTVQVSAQLSPQG